MHAIVNPFECCATTLLPVQVSLKYGFSNLPRFDVGKKVHNNYLAYLRGTKFDLLTTDASPRIANKWSTTR
jgi:hypothetical protein